jgi:hypothetical protein
MPGIVEAPALREVPPSSFRAGSGSGGPGPLEQFPADPAELADVAEVSSGRPAAPEADDPRLPPPDRQGQGDVTIAW